MKVIRYQNATDYLKANLSFLEKNEVLNSLIIGLVLFNQSIEKDETFYLSIIEDDEIQFTTIRTPGRKFIIAGNESKIEEVSNVFSEYLRIEKLEMPGILGPKELAIPLAIRLENVLRKKHKIVYRQLVYMLTKVKVNPKVSGKMKKAETKDLNFIIPWFNQFLIEALNENDLEVATKNANDKINNQEVFVWEKEKPVSMTCIARPTKNGITINYVYTPEDLRGNGYGTKIVAELSEKMLKQGYQFCTLFTDMDFPTSNEIYSKIGYEPVGEFRVVDFV